MKSSKILMTLGVAILVVCAFADSLSAQGRRGGMRGMFGRGGANNSSEMGLLAIEEVRKHLQDDHGLSEEAANALKKLADNAQSDAREEMGDMRGMRDMDEDERRTAIQEIQKAIKEINTKALKSAKDHLDKKQLKRLGELRIQQMGSGVFQDSVFQELLGISKEQIEKMQQLAEESREQQQEMMSDLREQFQSGGFDREAFTEKMQEMRSSVEKKTMGILSDGQKKQLEKMRGEKFEFPQRQQRRRRGRN